MLQQPCQWVAVCLKWAAWACKTHLTGSDPVTIIMLNFKKYQQYFIGTIVSITLFILSFAILAISLFSANRQQASQINQLTLPELISPPQN